MKQWYRMVIAAAVLLGLAVSPAVAQAPGPAGAAPAANFWTATIPRLANACRMAGAA